MSVFEDFEEIMTHAHFWNWAPDWNVAKEIYEKIPDSYSVLTPFAYSYLEEMIRTTTLDYGLPLFDRNKQQVKVRVGTSLVNFAMEENKKNVEYVKMLEYIKKHFKHSDANLNENGRNNVVHGHLHPRFWSQESFEALLHDIAKLSKFSKF